MKISTASIQPDTLRSGLSVALAVGALAVLSARVHAAELDPITISAPIVTTGGEDLLTGERIEKTTVKASIAADTETLTMDSGVVLLKDRVFEAARKACYAANPLTANARSCIWEAVKSAQPQVAAAIAQARSNRATG